jgi:hypothetical protein
MEARQDKTDAQSGVAELMYDLAIVNKQDLASYEQRKY